MIATLLLILPKASLVTGEVSKEPLSVKVGAYENEPFFFINNIGKVSGKKTDKRIMDQEPGVSGKPGAVFPVYGISSCNSVYQG